MDDVWGGGGGVVLFSPSSWMRIMGSYIMGGPHG